MDEGSVRGNGGGVEVGYRTAASVLTWELSPVGPGLYVLRGDCVRVSPALLAFGPLTVWIARGALRWSWTLDEVSIVEGRLETVVGQPTLAPLAARSR